MSIIFNCIFYLINFKTIELSNESINLNKPFISIESEQKRKYSKSEFVNNQRKYRYERLKKEIEYRKQEISYFKTLNRDTTQIIKVLEEHLFALK